MLRGAGMEVRGQHEESHLPPCVSEKLHSGHQICDKCLHPLSQLASLGINLTVL